MAVKCMDCKFAQWKRTSNGRLHPDKSGRCTWEQTMHISAAVYSWHVTDSARQNGVTFKGGWIGRDDTHLRECKVFQPSPTEATT